MRTLGVALVLLIPVLGPTGIEAGDLKEDWKVRVLFWVSGETCDEARVYLSVRDFSWARVAEIELPVQVRYRDLDWQITVPETGRYSLFAETTSCSGKRSSWAEVRFDIAGVDSGRHAYILIRFAEDTSQVTHLEVNTLYDATSRLVIKDESGAVSVTNLSDEEFVLCPRRHGATVRIQYLIDGEWFEFTRRTLPRNMTALPPGEPVRLSSEDIYLLARAVPPDLYDGELGRPTGKRYEFLGQQPAFSWWSDPAKRVAPQFPFCDIFYVQVPLAEDEPAMDKNGRRLTKQKAKSLEQIEWENAQRARTD